MKSKISFLFLLLTISAFPEDPIKIISSDFRSIILEFSPVYSKPVEQLINNQKYLNIGFEYGFVSSEIQGEPAVPEYNLNVGVPSETGNTIEVLNTIYNEIEGRITPIPKLVKDDKLQHYEYELNENYYNYKSPEEMAAFGEFGITRGLKKQSIRIRPVKFDPASNKIRLYSKITIKINFALASVNPSAKKDELVSDIIINYDIARQWGTTPDKILKPNVPTNSVLAEGTWVRFEVSEEGFYRITQAMLTDYGINAGSVDPRTIKIYNNGGKVLPEDPGDPRPVDLVENAIWVIGEGDGSFNDNDYILFYGRGTNFWDYDTTARSINRYTHPYSKQNFYWITSGGANGKRIQNKPGLNTTPGFIQTSTKAFAHWDEDKINVGQSGRYFAGDAFSQSISSRTYTTKLDHKIETPVNYRFRLINSSLEGNSIQFRVSENGTQLRLVSIFGLGDYDAGRDAVQTAAMTAPLPENRSLLKFDIVQPSISSVGYIDFFEIRYDKALKPVDNYLLFFSKDTSAIVEYRLSEFNSSNIKVFDVTDYWDVKSITLPTMHSGSQFNFQAAENEGKVSRYLAVGNDDFKTPANPVNISNSNLRGIADGAQFIIITHKNFLEAANKLKTYREGESPVPINTIVVDIQNIFNEFSGGILDVSAIRDFLKYSYDNWNIEPEYVLFFGSGNYDYKNIEGNNTNFIPTWQTVESLNLLTSFTTDDFFVQIDPGDDAVDFATGRITAKTLDEAQKIVNKIIEYENNSEIGLWRNLVTLVADDGNEDGTTHTSQSETLSTRIPDYFDLKKIYMQSYPTVLTGSGRRMPEVNQAIINSINEGTLILNYIGHGNPELWAHEVVFDRNLTIPQLKNENHYFFLVAATCSFGYFDIPGSRSASEDLLFLEGAGSIATLTASRVVYSSPNAAYTYSFYTQLLTSPRDENGYTISVGKANLNTKFNDASENTQKYFIFGDPTVRLQIPRFQASIDTINSMASAQTDIQIKALGKVSLKGVIKSPDSTALSNYNGEGILNVFDSERSEKINFGNTDLSVIRAGGVIFRGRVSITNGKFNGEFVVPKDISYENKRGKIVFYFYSSNEDGLGFTDKIIVGGTDSTAVNDGSGPEIEIFFDDPSYINTYLINPDSKLIVKLADETGINTTGTGVGHQLEGILNDDEANPIDFSGFFTGELDAGGKSGEINYSFDNIETGDYKIDVKAWDVYNNFSKETAYFSVVTGDDLVIRDVYNYPNPFTSNTTFTFQQNFNSALNVEVRVYTIAGRLIKIINEENVNERFVTIDWDGRDDDGDQLANGTYLYKLKVATTDGEYSKSILGKLAVIR